jgi:hypothetical protein
MRRSWREILIVISNTPSLTVRPERQYRNEITGDVSAINDAKTMKLGLSYAAANRLPRQLDAKDAETG